MYTTGLKFTSGLVYLKYRGEDLPVHIDMLSNISGIAADVVHLSSSSVSCIPIPDSLDPLGLDLFLSRIVYRGWCDGYPLTMHNTLSCAGVMGFFDVDVSLYSETDSMMFRTLDGKSPLVTDPTSPVNRLGDILLPHQPLIELYMPRTWSLLKDIRFAEILPDGTSISNPRARHPEKVALLALAREKSAPRIHSKTSATMELRRRRKLGRRLPVAMAVLAASPFDTSRFSDLLIEDDFLLLQACCEGRRLDALHALLSEIKECYVGHVRDDTGIELHVDGTIVMARSVHPETPPNDVLISVRVMLMMYAFKVVGIHADMLRLRTVSTHGAYFVVPMSVGMTRVLSWRTQMISIFCTVSPPVHVLADRMRGRW